MPKLANKNYPYPIITNDTSLSSYDGITYSFSFDKETTENQLILKNAKIETDSKTLINLLKENKVKAVAFVTCTRTYYRYTTEIGLEPRDITLKLGDLKDKVTISAYVYTNEDLNNYKSDECNEFYKDYSFDIDKYCLFAIDDGYKLPVEYDGYYRENERKRFLVRGGLIPPDSLYGGMDLSWDYQLQCEADYAENLSFRNDCKVFLAVFKTLLKRKNGHYGNIVRKSLIEERRKEQH